MYVIDQLLCSGIATEAEVGDSPPTEISACSDQSDLEAAQIRWQPSRRSRDVSVDDVGPKAAPQVASDRHPSGKPREPRGTASCSGDAARIDDEGRIRLRQYAVHGVRLEYRDDATGQLRPALAGVLRLLQPSQRVPSIFREISDETAETDQLTGGH
ncbi:hypothetical protein [Nocardia asiatica]|uniref:hypothetical protein n=1 Tax=Nocardia asiatica TaxID=209252 RepID=UPI003EE3C97B